MGKKKGEKKLFLWESYKITCGRKYSFELFSICLFFAIIMQMKIKQFSNLFNNPRSIHVLTEDSIITSPCISIMLFYTYINIKFINKIFAI